MFCQLFLQCHRVLSPFPPNETQVWSQPCHIFALRQGYMIFWLLGTLAHFHMKREEHFNEYLKENRPQTCKKCVNG